MAPVVCGIFLIRCHEAAQDEPLYNSSNHPANTMIPTDNASLVAAPQATSNLDSTVATTRIAPPASAITRSRWFYSIASLALLVLTFIGFQFFYLKGQAYPGRPLTPPIRTLVITHGILMSAWMLLSVVQPLLVGARMKRVHMKLGIFGVLLAVAMVVVGLRVGIEATRVNPPNFQLFGLGLREFMAVPVVGIIVFALFVITGVKYRRRPEIHRPMMFMASLSVVAAAIGRIPQMNTWYIGTWWESLFSAFGTSVMVGILLLAAKCIVSKSFDRWFAISLATLVLFSAAITLGAKTAAWDQFALFLLR
jgi:hypothetical protein